MNDELKEEFLSQLKWCVPKSSSGICDRNKDISITKVSSRTPLRLAITFRNGCGDKISDTGYVACCFHKNRVLFKSTPENEGYKMSHKNGDKNRYTQISPDTTALAFIGDYELKYDNFLELYYVEKGGGTDA